MIAIFLWSTVVTHENGPVVACGRCVSRVLQRWGLYERVRVFNRRHDLHSAGGCWGAVPVLLDKKLAISLA